VPPDSLAYADSLLTAILTEVSALRALQPVLPDTMAVSGALHMTTSTPWWDVAIAVGVLVATSLAAVASVFAWKTSQSAIELARNADFVKRQEDQDIASWVKIWKGIVAVRSFSNLPNKRTEIQRMDKSELFSRYVIPSFVLNRYWKFGSEQLNETWAECHAPLREEADRMYVELSEVGLQAGPIEPMGAGKRFEEAVEKLQQAVEEEFGASDPWALGFKDWEPIKTREVRSGQGGEESVP